MQQVGADTSRLEDRSLTLGVNGFRHGGSPSEWRTNLRLIRESLDDLERRNPGAKEDGKTEELREITYAVVNAMRRSDDAAFKRILRWTVERFPVPDPFGDTVVERQKDAEERFDRLTTRIADAYKEDENSLR